MPQESTTTETGSESTESTPLTPPTNQQSGQPTNDTPVSVEYLKALEDTLREQNRQISQLNNQIAQTQQQQAATREQNARQYDPEEDRTKFLTDPRAIVREENDALRSDFNKTIAPLLEFVQEFKGQNASTRIKAKVSADPRFSKFAQDRNIEAYVDQALGSLPAGTPITEALVTQAYITAIGAQMAGMIQKDSTLAQGNTPPTGQGNREMPNPPYIPPSPSAPPRGRSGGRELRDLTEAEERIRRERGMTKEAFLAWMDEPPSAVATSKIGKSTGGNQ